MAFHLHIIKNIMNINIINDFLSIREKNWNILFSSKGSVTGKGYFALFMNEEQEERKEKYYSITENFSALIPFKNAFLQ